MPTVLITGANRGLGLEFARQYREAGWQVIATARDPSHATALNALQVPCHALDVADAAAIAALGRRLTDPIDLLLCNAGLYGEHQDFGSVDPGEWMQVWAVNTMAPLLLAQALVGQIAASRHKIIACMTSKMGSMADNGSGGAYIYRSSKAGLNAVVKSLAVDLGPRGIRAVALHPGWVRTDMGGPHGLIDAATSVTGLRRVLDTLTPDQCGRVFDYQGREVPW